MTTKKPLMFATTARDLAITLFMPRDNEDHLGVFESESGVLYMRLTGSHTVGRDASGEFEGQYGTVIVYENMARQIAKILNDSMTGNVKLRISARQEVTINQTPNQTYINGTWIVWGFEYDGKYYTTEAGKLVISDPKSRSYSSDKQNEAGVLNNMLKTRAVVDNQAKTTTKGSRRAKL